MLSVNFQTATGTAAWFSGNDKEKKNIKSLFYSDVPKLLLTAKIWFTPKHNYICNSAANTNHMTDKLPDW